MPVTRYEATYCYCSPPRYAMVTRYSLTERVAMAVTRVVSPLSNPVVAFIEWLGRPPATIQMVERKDTEPMCGRSFRQELTELDRQAAAEGGRMTDAEASRALHRRLFNAVRDACTYDEIRTAERAWDAHMAEHREMAAQVRAERTK